MRWKVSRGRSRRWAGGRGLPAAHPPEAASPPGLPVDLQYLPPDKQREEEPDIRKMLLEAIMLVGARHRGAEDRSHAQALLGVEWRRQAPARCLLRQPPSRAPRLPPAHAAASFPWQLTATKAGRHAVREKGTYLVLRELHRWEREPDVLAACEKLIQVGTGTWRSPAWGCQTVPGCCGEGTGGPAGCGTSLTFGKGADRGRARPGDGEPAGGEHP